LNPGRSARSLVIILTELARFSVKMDLTEVGSEDVIWIELGEDRAHW